MDMSKFCSPKKEEQPRTLEELFVQKFTEQEKILEANTDMLLNERQKSHNLQKIVDTLKKHATLENGTVCIFITGCHEEERDYIVKSLELKEEGKPNE